MFLKYFLFIIIFYASSIKACEKPTMPSKDAWNNWLQEVRKEALDILKELKEIKIIEFDHTDVVRHPLVSKIIRAYQKKSTDDKS